MQKSRPSTVSAPAGIWMYTMPRAFFCRFCPRWPLNFFFLLFNCKNHTHSHEWSCRIELRVEIFTKANFSFAYFFMVIIRPAFDFDFSLFKLFWALDIFFNSFLSLDSLHKLIGILTVWLVEQVPSWYVVTSYGLLRLRIS